MLEARKAGIGTNYYEVRIHQPKNTGKSAAALANPNTRALSGDLCPMAIDLEVVE
jgi:hypothetical protein